MKSLFESWILNPVAFQVGPLVIYWYGIAYIVAFLLAWSYALWLEKNHSSALTKTIVDSCFGIPGLLGVVIGGRLGHILFYAPAYYLSHPLEILMTWKGGMSFHGGLLGVIIALYFVSKQWKNVSYLAIMDLLAVVTPIGLGLGRLANFVNGELYGKISQVPWALSFPTGGIHPRHPSQLYEAILEGVVLFLILNIVWRKTQARHKPGYLSGIFLIGYALSRFMIEFVRENPPAPLELIPLSMGQYLCIPMLLLGSYLIYRGKFCVHDNS